MAKSKKLKKTAVSTADAVVELSPVTPAPSIGPSKKIMKKKKKVKKTGSAAPTPEAKAPVPIPTSEAKAPVLVTTTPSQTVAAVGVVTLLQGQKREYSERISGFIFFCSAATKLECFQFRVFALPKGRMELVGRIKTGARLFLYDYNERLLYGIFRATSTGGMNLVSEAFGGKYPAQVKFKIEKDCVPLPESVFKQAIEENYEAPNRFKPDLNSKQIHKLCAMFKPVDVQSQIAPSKIADRVHAPPLVHLPPPERLPIPAQPTVDPHYVHPYGPPAARDPYLPAPQYLQRQPVPESRQVLSVNMHADVPYYPAPQNSTYPRADQQAYYPDHKHASYRVIPELVTRDAVPPTRDYLPVRDYPSARDYRTVTSDITRSEPYYIERVTAHAPSDVQYNDPSRPYGETIHRTLSNRVPTSAPVSSLYSFAGAAPTYR